MKLQNKVHTGMSKIIPEYFKVINVVIFLLQGILQATKCSYCRMRSSFSSTTVGTSTCYATAKSKVLTPDCQDNKITSCLFKKKKGRIKVKSTLAAQNGQNDSSACDRHMAKLRRQVSRDQLLP